MKLKFAPGHVALRVDLSEMQQLVDTGTLSSEIDLSGGIFTVIVSLVDEEMSNMAFDPGNSTIGFVYPREAAIAELAKPTRGGIGGYFDQGVFSLAIDMHDIREKARDKAPKK